MDENRADDANVRESDMATPVVSAPLLTAVLLFVVLPLVTMLVAIVMWAWE